MIFPEKYVDGIYQDKKMFVKVKDVGSYKIHVEKTFCANALTLAFFIIMISIGCVLEFSWFYNRSINPLIPLGGAAIALAFLLNIGHAYSESAYYVDTTMYGIGGKTIRETTPEQDHIAICKASHEFEMQILERIKKEEEFKEIVGVCK